MTPPHSQPGTEERMIQSLAAKLMRWKGGGFNLDTREREAREMAVEIISDVRRATT